MPVELAYQIMKDIFVLAKMDEADPIDPGTTDFQKLAAMGIVDAGDNAENYSWIRPSKLFSRTEAPEASHEVVWVSDGLRRSKRKVVRFTHRGSLDSVLIRRKTS